MFINNNMFNCCLPFVSGTDLLEVEFYAYLGTELSHVPVGTTLKFDGVGNNQGNGYDNSTGVFTCPSSGLYLFMVYIMPHEGSEVSVSLMYNGQGFAHAAAEPSFNGQDITGATARAFRLNKGDRVWVEVINQDSSFWYSYTSFSGLLIHR